VIRHVTPSAARKTEIRFRWLLTKVVLRALVLGLLVIGPSPRSFVPNHVAAISWGSWPVQAPKGRGTKDLDTHISKYANEVLKH
jgi:hypothetical protein